MSEPESNLNFSTDSVISSPSNEPIYDVVVVGAGPVGLATAIGLRKRGIENLLVIDQTSAFRRVGQGIDLLPNGLKALKSLDFNAYEEVKKTGINFLSLNSSNNQKTSPQWIQKNFHGKTISSISLKYEDWLKDYGEGRVTISWYDLQTTLRALLPQDSIKINHRCINVVHEPQLGCVRIDCCSEGKKDANVYAHWSTQNSSKNIQSENSNINAQELTIKSIRAKIVVAADGINSQVRRVLYQDSLSETVARPEYSGFAAIGCSEIALVPEELLRGINERFLIESRIVTIFNDERSKNSAYIGEPRMIVIQRGESKLGYIIHLALPIDLLTEKSGNSLVDLALQELSKTDFPQVLKELVKISPSENMYQRPYYINRATYGDALLFPNTANLNLNESSDNIKPLWSKERVVLIGDAAHGMPPFMAQGANQGLEDALSITTAITNIPQPSRWDDTKAISEAFSQYESIRRPFMVYIQQATLRRLSKGSKQEWEKYSQLVYGRNFEEKI